MITIHHLHDSRSERIIWLMEELGLPYELDFHYRVAVGGGRLAPEAMKAIQPFGTAPVITDGDVTIAESGAIIEYVIHKYGKGCLSVGPQAANYGEYLFWLHFAEGTLMSQVLREFLLDRISADQDSFPAKRVRERSKMYYDYIEARIAASPYFAGLEFSAADIMMVFPFTTLQSFKVIDLAPYPSLRAYLARIAARPAYK
ncbi:MAG: glutathione S-transferase family protein [Rhodospirillales bacterium]